MSTRDNYRYKQINQVRRDSPIYNLFKKDNQSILEDDEVHDCDDDSVDEVRGYGDDSLFDTLINITTNRDTFHE